MCWTSNQQRKSAKAQQSDVLNLKLTLKVQNSVEWCTEPKVDIKMLNLKSDVLNFKLTFETSWTSTELC